jgi:aminopeptidase N
MIKRNFLAVLFLFSVTWLPAQKSPALEALYDTEWQTFREFVARSESYVPDTAIDVTFYHLDLSIAIDSPYIAGTVRCDFFPVEEALSNVVLSLNSALTVDGVAGNAASFVQSGDSILISLDGSYGPGDKLTLLISYHGVPVMAGGYKGLRYETHHGSEPVIATLSTPYLAHYWYPCKDGPSDKPDSVYVDITVPVKVVNGQEVIAVSNGIMENVIDNGSHKTYQWRHRYPIVTYYVMAAISNYVLFSDYYSGSNGEEYPLDYYVFQQDLAISQAGTADMPLALDIFSEKFGIYPFANEKYGMTQLGFYGAIENQTNTITNNMSPSWFDVSVHELSHMWFGDMITCRDWHHGWLNEGFATYSEALYDEAIYGYEAYQQNMQTNEYWNGGTLYLQNAADTFNIFQNIIYRKGAYVLHMLRGVLGDSAFFDGVRTYASDPDLMYAQAVTEDLMEICEEVSGEELGYFFDQWVYDAYYPVYYYNFENIEGGLAFLIYQVQGQQGWRPVFEMPVEVLIEFAGGGDTLVRVWNDEAYQVFTLPVGDEVSMISVDPEKRILRKAYYHPEIPVGIGESISEPAPASVVFFPNPVHGSATMDLDFTGSEHALLVVCDLGGRELMRIGGLRQGRHRFDRGSLSGGVYAYYLLDADGRRLAKGKLILL